MQFSTILAAIDLEDDLAEGVVRAAHSLAQKDGARLVIVSVWPTVSAVTPTFSAEVAASSAVLSQGVIEQHRKGREDSVQRITTLAERLAPGARAAVLDGEPADAVAEYANETHADLIVTGSHQRNFWNTLFQGSASRELVQEAPCAVFLVTKAFAAKLAGRQ
ncbi:MAG: universal stress protein [Pseudomonadota bacterium]